MVWPTNLMYKPRVSNYLFCEEGLPRALAHLVALLGADESYVERLAQLGGAPAESWSFVDGRQADARDGWAWGSDEADALAAALTLSFGGGVAPEAVWERREWDFDWGGLNILQEQLRGVVEGGFWPHHFVVGPAQNSNALVAFGSIETSRLPLFCWKPMELSSRGAGVESRLLFAPPIRPTHG